MAGAIVLTGTSYVVMKTRQPAGEMVVNVVKGIHMISMDEADSLIGKKSPTEIRKPKKLPLPPPVMPTREVSGIVQIAFTVNTDGSASNVHVIGAAPRGYYEEQAKAIVESGYYKPTLGDDGQLHPRAGSTIIHFTVPAHRTGPPTPARH